MEGRELQGKRIGFGRASHYSQAAAEADLAPYPVGATPPVRYNPAKPEECVLETSRPSSAFLWITLVGAGLVVFGIFLPSIFR